MGISIDEQFTPEKCSDPVDDAANLTYINNQEQVQQARAKSAPETMIVDGVRVSQIADSDGSYPVPNCVDCDDPLVLFRLQMGRIRCVACQEHKERFHGR